jgi:hypothetical protein
MTTIGIYFPVEYDANTLRAELARIALAHGYKQRKRGKEIEAGSIGRLLAAIASGEVTLIRKEHADGH